MELVGDYASRIIVMNKGRIEHDGTPSEVFGMGNKLEEIGLGVPQITKLMARLNEYYPEIARDVYTIEDAQRIIGGILRRGR